MKSTDDMVIHAILYGVVAPIALVAVAAGVRALNRFIRAAKPIDRAIIAEPKTAHGRVGYAILRLIVILAASALAIFVVFYFGLE